MNSEEFVHIYSPSRYIANDCIVNPYTLIIFHYILTHLKFISRIERIEKRKKISDEVKQFNLIKFFRFSYDKVKETDHIMWMTINLYISRLILNNMSIFDIRESKY